MGDIDRGHADLALQASEFPAHILAELFVNGGQGLIEEQRLGPADNRARQRHLLPRARRQGAGVAPEFSAQIEDFGHPGKPFGDLARGHAPGPQGKEDVLAHVQVGVERNELEHHRDVAPAGGQVVDAAAVKQDIARTRLFQPRDTAQGGGLAAT